MRPPSLGQQRGEGRPQQASDATLPTGFQARAASLVNRPLRDTLSSRPFHPAGLACRRPRSLDRLLGWLRCPGAIPRAPAAKESWGRVLGMNPGVGARPPRPGSGRRTSWPWEGETSGDGSRWTRAAAWTTNSHSRPRTTGHRPFYLASREDVHSNLTPGFVLGGNRVGD